MQFGVGLFGGFPPSRFRELVKLVEAEGFSHLWIADEGLHRNPYSVLASAALTSSRLQLGTGVTNPYTRHPALTAAAIATLDELSGGRAILGIGRGGSAPLALGLRKSKPAATVRDALAIINSLTATGRAQYTGASISFNGTLDFIPRRRVPIYLAATGTSMLRLAGEGADGVIVGDAATHQAVNAALSHVGSGAAGARRDGREISVVCWWATAITSEAGLGREAVRRIVAVSIMNHRYRLEEIGVRLSAAMREVLREYNWTRSHDSVEALSHVLSEEALETLSLTGPPEACVERILSLKGLPLAQIGVLFRPPRESTFEEQIRLFGERVMARL